MSFLVFQQLYIQVITYMRYGIEDTILSDPSSSTGETGTEKWLSCPKPHTWD